MAPAVGHDLLVKDHSRVVLLLLFNQTLVLGRGAAHLGHPLVVLGAAKGLATDMPDRVVMSACDEVDGGREGAGPRGVLSHVGRVCQEGRRHTRTKQFHARDPDHRGAKGYVPTAHAREEVIVGKLVAGKVDAQPFQT